jgi:hypothetical protein
MLQQLISNLYNTTPTAPLYHYTSLSGMMGIVNSKAIWTSEIKYLNDADELRYLGKIVNSILALRETSSDQANEIWRQFRDWIRERLDHGHMLFVGSFTENGNLLSQWRGYCPPGKGVSIGFSPSAITAAAQRQSFLIGKCVYDRKAQDDIVEQILEAVLSTALSQGPAPKGKKHPTQSYWDVFNSIELDILRIAALLKNPAFREEVEWRIVSPFYINVVQAPIKYRDGPRMLVPYVEFSIADDSGIACFENVYVGPTANLNLSLNSIHRFLAKNAKCPKVSSSQLPYVA